MSRNKLIAVSIIIFALLLTLCIFLVLEKNKATDSTTHGGNENNNASSSGTTSQLKTSPSSTTGGFPTTPPSTQNNNSAPKQSLPDNVSYSFVHNINDSAEVQKVYDAFISKAKTPTAKPLEWTQFFNPDKSVIPLSKADGSIGLNVNKAIAPILDDYDYELFYCTSGNKKDYGIQLTIKYVPNYSGNVLTAAEKFMKEWENTMLADTHSTLFPGIQFTSAALQQKLTFRDGKYRYAIVTLPDESKKSINYTFIGDYIVITSSQECLDKTSPELVAPSD